MHEQQMFEIAVEVVNNGFQTVLQKYEFEPNTLLKILYVVSNNSKCSEAVKKRILEITRQQLHFLKFSFQDKKIGVIADTNLGSKFANWDYIKIACNIFDKEKIKNIFLIGNIFGSSLQQRNKTICFERLYELYREYPKGFQTFVLLAEQEKTFKEVDLDLKKELTKLRKDIVPINGSTSYAQWEERHIAIKSKITKESISDYLENAYLTIGGHSHYYSYNPEYRTLKAPTCSDNYPTGRKENKYQPGFIILENKEKGIIAHRYGFDEKGAKHILKRVIKEESKY